jgi:hypothetical protein
LQHQFGTPVATLLQSLTGIRKKGVWVERTLHTHPLFCGISNCKGFNLSSYVIYFIAYPGACHD